MKCRYVIGWELVTWWNDGVWLVESWSRDEMPVCDWSTLTSLIAFLSSIRRIAGKATCCRVYLTTWLTLRNRPLLFSFKSRKYLLSSFFMNSLRGDWVKTWIEWSANIWKFVSSTFVHEYILIKMLSSTFARVIWYTYCTVHKKVLNKGRLSWTLRKLDICVY